jgi:hypothetical protein
MKQLFRILPALVAVMLFQTGIEKKGSFDITLVRSDDAEVSVAPDLQKKGSFDLTFVVGKAPELPVLS